MSRDVMTAAPEIPAWTRDLATAISSYQALLERVKMLDTALQDARASQENEAESRLLWQRRAKDYESRIAQNQYVLLLIDGNQTCFKDEYIRQGSKSTQQLAKQLISEVHTMAKHQHKNDLSESKVLINIFLDVERLAQDLIAAGSITTRQQLDLFLKALSAADEFISVVDCGSGGAVDSKMKAMYEHNIENCHCRHIILALGQRSEYYETLDMYSEDDYTKSKTSLVVPENGLPTSYSLPFHTVEFSFMNTVRLIAFSEIASVHDEEPANTTELRGLSAVPFDQTVVGTDNMHTKPPLGLASSQHAASSHSSRTAGSKSSHGSVPSAVKPNALDGSLNKSSPKPSSPAVSFSPQSTQKVSPYEEEMSSYQQDWEQRVGVNTYAPPAIAVPWGEEEVVGGNIPTKSNEKVWPTPSFSNRQQPSSTPRRPARQPTHQPRADSNYVQHSTTHNKRETSNAKPGQSGIETFEGGWDDQEIPDVDTPAAKPTIALPPPSVDGLAPTPERPICSAIGLNKSRRRIDLPLPDISSEDLARFRERNKRKRLCNEHHIRLACADKGCRYDHSEIDAGILLALRHTARTLPCHIGGSCRLHECFAAHRCPFLQKPGGCTKQPCPFRKKGLHDVSDLDIVEIIPIPANG